MPTFALWTRAPRQGAAASSGLCYSLEHSWSYFSPLPSTLGALRVPGRGATHRNPRGADELVAGAQSGPLAARPVVSRDGYLRPPWPLKRTCWLR